MTSGIAAVAALNLYALVNQKQRQTSFEIPQTHHHNNTHPIKIFFFSYARR
jgi:hypothetical protein